MSGTTRSTHAGGAGVEDMAKDFWATRPRRPRRGRKIAGVAAGIANRYRIDPTLVRVGLVVAAVYGGAGIVLYLLGWLFLPEQDDEVAPFEALLGRGRSSTSAVFTMLLCLAFIPTFSWFFGGFVPGYVSVLAAFGVLYLLHRSRGGLGGAPEASSPTMANPMMATPTMTNPTMATPTMASPTGETAADTSTMPTSTTPPAPPFVAEPTVAASTGSAAGVTAPLPQPDPGSAGPRHETEAEPRTTPPSWDPLGAAPFAWDLPDPNPPLDDQEPEPPVRQPRSRIGLLTVGVALLAVAGMTVAGMGGWITPEHIIGVVLAVLGLGMVAGSFVRAGRGLIGLAVPLAVVGIGMTVVAPEGWKGIGEIETRPTTLAAVADEYSRSVGSITLDLTALPASGEVDTTVELGTGDVTVIVPRTADLELEIDHDTGSVTYMNESWDAWGESESREFTDDGPDGPGGLDVNLTIDAGVGSVEVHRG